MEDAVVGRLYRVEWDDCCAKGSFKSVLAVKQHIPDPPEPTPFLDGLLFANGVTISGHGVQLTELVGGDPA
jgi:hypothetical protein